VINIAQEFINSGKDIYVVGGAIRDFLQGKKPKDFDLVTNALPEESKKILSSKFRVSDEQGKNFGVIRVFTEDEPEGYEIASYRKDISGGRDTKGDDQKVELGSHITIDDDVKRRDLTINSLFYDINKKEIVDLVGGIDDIETGNIRAVGNPEERFKEDRLRILRVFRFVARVNGKIDELTSQAIKKDNRLKGISTKEDVSQERIIDELQKSYSQAQSYVNYLNLLTEYNMWEQIFTGAKINTKVVSAQNYITYLANLFKNEDTSKLEKKLVEDLKFDSNSAMKIVFLIKLLDLKPENVLELYNLKNDPLEKENIISKNKNIYLKYKSYRECISVKEIKSSFEI
jgi:tRNA nucleotidyltransferase/poly(A) polymerase